MLLYNDSCHNEPGKYTNRRHARLKILLMQFSCLPYRLPSYVTVYAFFFALHAVRTGVPRLSFTVTSENQHSHWTHTT